MSARPVEKEPGPPSSHLPIEENAKEKSSASSDSHEKKKKRDYAGIRHDEDGPSRECLVPMSFVVS